MDIFLSVYCFFHLPPDGLSPHVGRVFFARGFDSAWKTEYLLSPNAIFFNRTLLANVTESYETNKSG
jgi:hypothetical protein